MVVRFIGLIKTTEALNDIWSADETIAAHLRKDRYTRGRESEIFDRRMALLTPVLKALQHGVLEVVAIDADRNHFTLSNDYWDEFRGDGLFDARLVDYPDVCHPDRYVLYFERLRWRAWLAERMGWATSVPPTPPASDRLAARGPGRPATEQEKIRAFVAENPARMLLTRSQLTGEMAAANIIVNRSAISRYFFAREQEESIRGYVAEKCPDGVPPPLQLWREMKAAKIIVTKPAVRRYFDSLK